MTTTAPLYRITLSNITKNPRFPNKIYLLFTKILLYYAIYCCQGSCGHSIAIRVGTSAKKRTAPIGTALFQSSDLLNRVRVGVVAVHYPVVSRHRACGATDFGEHPRELLIGGFVSFRSPFGFAEHQPNIIGILRPSCGEFNLARPRVEFSPSVGRL